MEKVVPVGDEQRRDRGCIYCPLVVLVMAFVCLPSALATAGQLAVLGI